MKPRAFLDVADALCTGTNEAEWRTAVSRAYYAAFHTARLLFREWGFVVPQVDQVHTYLWLRLANSGHPDVMNAGRNLGHLRQRRNWADYNLERPLEQPSAIGYVQTAVAIVDLLETVAGEAAVLTAVTESMRIYERDVLGQVTWQA